MPLRDLFGLKIGVFEADELLTFALALAAFAGAVQAYRSPMNTPKTRNQWKILLAVSSFWLVNRLLTNLESVWPIEVNVLEHASFTVGAVALAWFVRKVVR